MAGTRTLITQLYAAFNRRDIDAALALMTDDVDWPKASESGRVVGKQGIRAYWTRQWSTLDPHVDPTVVTEPQADKAVVKVHQLVKDTQGKILADVTAWHVYMLANGLVTRMDVHEQAPS